MGWRMALFWLVVLFSLVAPSRQRPRRCTIGAPSVLVVGCGESGVGLGVASSIPLLVL